ncbi:MAG: DUF6288 domain-containing protein [Planctomycetota bacterium]
MNGAWLPPAAAWIAAALALAASAAPPDFTRGDPIPKRLKHDWNLGAIGARGWIYCDKLVTTDARQVLVTQVQPDSPADGVLAIGDVLVGVDGKPFDGDPRSELGNAIRAAETEAGRGSLALIRWRAGETEQVEIKLPILGDYSDTAPYDCDKSRRILEQGCGALARRVAAPGYRQNPITRSLNALALLASGDPEFVPLVKREAEWASGFSASSFQTWYYGYVVILLAEYTMATGDDSFVPALRRLSLEAANGQSVVGSWGHRFRNPDGRLGGYGMMNAPGLTLTIGLVLARQAGVDDPEVERAIQRSVRLIRFYVDKGAVPYGDHHPWIQTHEDNGKCGMAAVLLNLLDDAEGAEFFTRMSVASHGPERDTGHTGNFFNLLWSAPGVALSGPHASGAWMEEFGGWYFDLARRADGTFVHQGPPEPRKDSYHGWDCTGAYLLAYAAPLRAIYLTGKRPSTAPQLDRAEAEALIEDGRGWSNKNRNGYYDSLSLAELLTRVESWSPVVRERAGMALARRKAKPIAQLSAMLESPSLATRYGACQALAKLRRDAAPAVPRLRQALAHEDLWLRVKAAEALAAIGKPAAAAVPELLVRLAAGPSDDDPRGMEQRYLCFALFNRRGGMLAKSVDGVDREALHSAIRAGLKNEDGRARGSVGAVYQNLSYSEIKPLLPAIHQAVVNPAPSGIMFADSSRMTGLRVLAKHRVRDGMRACVDYLRTQNLWGSQGRTASMMDLLLRYGAHGKPFIPELEQLAARFEGGGDTYPKRQSLDKARVVREAIAAIAASEDYPSLVELDAP